MQYTKLNDVYPLFHGKMLGLFISGILTSVLAILVLVFAVDTEPLAVLFGAGVPILLTFFCFLTVISQALSRYALRQSVICYSDCGTASYPKPVAICRHKDLDTVEGQLYFHSVSRTDQIVKDITIALSGAGFHLHVDAWMPVTFLTLKPKGTVSWKWGSIERRCRGISKGHWCEVEVQDDHTQTEALIMHELAHVAISASDVRLSSAEQHMWMKRSGIN